MNWTGGSLQRTKKANSGMLQRQKAHFAKARTNLQDIFQTPATPFRPSYLRDNDKSGPMAGSSFSSISVRRKGRHVTDRGETAQPEHIRVPDGEWSTISSHEVSPHGLSSRRVAHHHFQSETPPQTQEDLRIPKRKAPDTDAEIELLEAKKRRLLTQPDWIGISPSKPVSLQFLSCKQKERIGKRRITTGKGNVMKRQCINGDSKREDLDAQHRTFAEFLQDRVKHGKPENIRIHIGTDAMTDTHSTQLEEHARSEASSDLMLFEQNRSFTDQPAGDVEFGPLVTSQGHTVMSAVEQDGVFSHASATGEDARHHDNVSGHAQSAAVRNACGKLLAQQPQLAAAILDEHEGFRFVHPARDDECALRLVFSGSDSSMGIRTLNATGKQEIDETQLPREPTLALRSQAEHVHRITNDSEDLSAYAIVDREPWTAYLAISDNCSRPHDTRIHTRELLQLDDTDTKNKSGAATSWSQHATQGQDDGGSFGTLPNSDSLPSLRRGIRRPVAGHGSEMKLIRRSPPNSTDLQPLDEDEKRWQAFVLGCDKRQALQMQRAHQHQHAGRHFAQTFQYPENVRSGYLPLSVAAGSASSPPRNAANSRFGFWTSEDA